MVGDYHSDFNKVGVELSNYAVIKTPFKVEETPSPGYADISSVENWWNFGEGLKDYIFIRKQIKNLIREKGINDCIGTLSTPPTAPLDGDKYYIDPNTLATGAWEGYEDWCATWNETNSVWTKEPIDWIGYRVCNITEKSICAELKIGSQLDHFLDYGVPAIVDYGFTYHKTARETRIDRMLRCTVEVYNILPLNAAECLTNITTSPLGDLYTRYIEFGVKGSLEDYNKDFNPNPTPGIIDWIYARAPFNNTEPYISAGFPSGLILKGWSTVDGSTIQEFADVLNNILN